MLDLRKIAVTGGISSGKSTVCRVLQECGAFVVNADLIVSNLLSSSKLISNKIIELLGDEVLEAGTLSKQKIANKVFKDEYLLKQLENILHPEVFKEIDNQFIKLKQTNSHPFFVAEIPLLFETENEKLFDLVITVSADLEHCLKRTNLSTADFMTRMQWQLETKEKEKKSDFIIENNGSLSELKTQTKKLYKKLINR